MTGRTVMTEAPRSHFDAIDVFEAFEQSGDTAHLVEQAMRTAYDLRDRWEFLEFARENEHVLRPGLRHKWAHIRRYAALLSHLDVAQVAQLMTDRDGRVRECGARSPLANAVALVDAADDPDVGVRRMVAQNLNTPVNTLIRLLTDVDLDVRIAAADHPFLPDAVQRLLYLDDWPDDLAQVGEVITQRLTSRVEQV